MSSIGKTVATTFVVIVVALVGIAALGGLLTAESDSFEGPDRTNLSLSQYDYDRVSPNTSPGTASISMDSDENEKTIVFDVGPRVQERQVLPLINTLVQEGHSIVVHNPDKTPVNQNPFPQLPQNQNAQATQIGPGPGPGPGQGGGQTTLQDRLDNAHGFVSIGVDGYSSDQIDALANFTSDDGRVIFMTNPDKEFQAQFSSTNLLESLGLSVQPGYVYNMEQNDMNYQRLYAEPASDSMLTEGVDQVVFSTATTVQTREGTAVMRPVDGAELSTTRESTDAPIMVRNESAVLIGDSRFLIPENTQRADNDVLVGNLADFLVTGDRLLESDFQTIDDDNGDSGDDENEQDGNETDSFEGPTVTVGPDGQPRFQPNELNIEPGTTVRFVWESSGYSLVPRDIPENATWSGVPEPKEEGFEHTHTFTVEGTYVYTAPEYESSGMIAGIIVGNGTSEG